MIMTFAQSALCTELLTPNHLFHTSEQSDEFAFESSDKTAFCKIHPKQSAHLWGKKQRLPRRKGGDGGRDTANMLQFKLDPTQLFDI